MNELSATGHCLCGATGVQVDAKPISANFCHCESCRRHTGSVVAAFVTFPKSAVRWSGAERKHYRSSPSVLRSFCSSCGSPIAYEHADSAEEIDLYLGVFDDPTRYPPQKHIHCHERVAWFDTIDHSPRYEIGSRAGEVPMTTEPTTADNAPLPAGQIPPISRP